MCIWGCPKVKSLSNNQIQSVHTHASHKLIELLAVPADEDCRTGRTGPCSSKQPSCTETTSSVEQL